MKHYGLTIAEGSEITNPTIATGVAFPGNESVGELFFRTDANTLYVWDGSAWDISSPTEVVGDLSPQLGGDLDLNGFDIITAGAASPDAITIEPGDATGITGADTSIRGGTSTNATSGGGGTLELKAGDATIPATTGTGGQLRIEGGDGTTSGGDVVLQPGRDVTDNSADGNVVIIGGSGGNPPALRFNEALASGAHYVALKAPTTITTTRTWVLPQDDPTAVAGQLITTDASGNLSFAAAIDSVVADTSPQLGGDLDVNDFKISNGTASLDLNDTSATLLQSANGTIGQQFSIFAGTGSAGAGGLLTLIGGQGTVVGGSLRLSGGRGTAGGGGDVTITPGQGSTADGGFVVFAAPIASTTAPKLLVREAAVSGTNAVTLKSPDSIAIDRTWTLPVDDPVAAAGLFITTDASGNLSFAGGGGGLNSVVEDLSPQLGGNLDVNDFDIVGKPPTTTTSPGGVIDIIASNGGATSGIGGAINITAGSGLGASDYGGDITITTGDGYKSGDFNVVIPQGNGYAGGSVDVRAGAGATGYDGGNATLFAGNGYQGGIVEITAGSAVGGGTTPGSVIITAGSSAETGSSGASATLKGGVGVSSGGSAIVEAANSTGVAGTPGNVELRPGYDQNAPTNPSGNVILRNTQVTAPPPDLRFNDTDNSAYIALKSPAVVAVSRTWTLPDDDPSIVAGDFITTDASGNLSFAAGGGGAATKIEDSGDATTFVNTEYSGGGGAGLPFNMRAETGARTTGSGAGGNMDIRLGQGAQYGAGGVFNLYTGYGGYVDPAQGGPGGNMRVVLGRGYGNNYGGGFFLYSGNSGPTLGGAGGNMDIRLGEGASGGGTGGDFNLYSGNGGGAGTGGRVRLYAGAAGSVSGNGGSIQIKAGNGGATSGTGGDVTLQPGNGNTFGDIKIEPPGGGTEVSIRVGTGVPTHSATNGSLFMRTDGGAGTTFYVREVAAWVAK